MNNRHRLCLILVLGCVLCLLLVSTWSILVVGPNLYGSGAARAVSGDHLSGGDRRTTYLLIIIPSSAGHTSRRATVRNTWLKFSSPHTQHLFVVGARNGLRPNESAALLAESNRNGGDILLLPSADDDYDSLTRKVLAALVHVDTRWRFKFLLKCDDDSFVRLPQIENELLTRFAHTANLYWGFFSGDAAVLREGRFKETEWNLCDRYIPFARGGGYVLSESVVHFISKNHQYLNIYHNEDVAVGTWLAPVNVTKIHDPRFDTEISPRGCSNTYLITHKRTEEDFRFFHNNIVLTGKLCDTEYKSRASYSYDWHAPPSKCCAQTDPSIP